MFQRRAIEEHDEEESIFISMTDLSVSMLLLIIILLGFFASQFRDTSLFAAREAATAELDRLSAALEVAQNRMSQFEIDISVLERQLSEKTVALAVSQSQQKIAEETVGTTAGKLALAQTSLEVMVAENALAAGRSAAEVEQLLDEKLALSVANDALQSDLARVNSQKREAELTADLFNDELRKAQLDQSQAEETIKSTLMELAAVQTSLGTMTAQSEAARDRLARQVRKLLDEKQALSAASDELRRDLDLLKSKGLETKMNSDRLDVALKESREANEILQEKLRDSETKTSSLLKQNESLERAIRRQQIEIATLQNGKEDKSVTSTQQEMATLQTANQRLSRDVERMSNEIGRLENKVRSTQSLFDALLNSTVSLLKER